VIGPRGDSTVIVVQVDGDDASGDDGVIALSEVRPVARRIFTVVPAWRVAGQQRDPDG
jgi:hypothetical protein